ncbi:hypothetical protein [Flindersiella endophytica]
MELVALFTLGVPFGVLTAIVVVQRLTRIRRRRAMRQYADAQDWQWVGERDQAYAHRWNGEPFAGGKDRIVRNVMLGRPGDYEVNAFDYQHRTGTGGKGRVFVATVLTLRLPAALPELAVGPEGAFGGRAAAAVGRADLQTESEAFNRAYRVGGDDARYAMAVLHPRMMELLLSAPRTSWRIERDWLVHWEPGRTAPDRIGERLGLLAAIAGLIPSYVWTDYGS